MQNAYYAAGHIDDAASIERVAELFTAWNPGFRLGCARHSGESDWIMERGSRVCWIQEGRGEVLVPQGYRTKEGDGEALPAGYEPEPAPRDWIDAVHYAQTRVECFKGDLRTAVTGICSRLQTDRYIGDAANDLWAWLEYDGVAPDPQFAAFIRLFQDIYDQIGYSVKRRAGWEPVREGDQILVGSEPLRVKGDFRYWFIETPEPITHISSLRRLRYLKDTAGGCNFQFDAFRRMSLTYYALRGVTAENPDGINQLNSHFVNIAAETSRAHYHPRQAVGGGKPQGEFYFVAEPGVHHLSTYGRSAKIELWPGVESDNSGFHEGLSLPLRPGSIVYITPGTAHRGVDVFANVVVLPAYKLKNQYFVSPPIETLQDWKPARE